MHKFKLEDLHRFIKIIKKHKIHSGLQEMFYQASFFIRYKKFQRSKGQTENLPCNNIFKKLC